MNEREGSRRMSDGLFAGTTVIELGHVIAAPFAASLLADFGATVIKVEDPGVGDMMRSTGPTKDGFHLWWKAVARNKTSVTIDLRSAEGQALVKRMVEKADVVVENFRPGTLERWHLDWESLRAINPRLIMLRISGYGQIGPDARKPGYGRVGEALSGAVHITGHPDKPPTHFGFSLGDLSTGLMGAFSIASALFKRERLGAAFPGECIDLALYETLYRCIDWQIVLYDQLGFIAERAGNSYPVGPSPIADTYQTSDGAWVTVATGTTRSVHNLLELIGGSELKEDKKYATHELLMKHRIEIGNLVSEWIRNNPLAKVLESCCAAAVVAAPVFTPREMMSDETFRIRENIVTVDDPELGAIRVAGVVPRMLNFPGSVRSSGPALAEGNRRVFIDWLGLTEDDYEGLAARGIVESAPEQSHPTGSSKG